MGYTLCVLGCGTMGVAITSGILASLEARSANGPAGPTPSKSGTSTPVPSYMLYAADSALPSRFIACVRRSESAKKLRRLFATDFAERGENIEIVSGGNVAAAKECDVLLLCCKPQVTAQILGEEGMKDALRNKLVISIMAGVTISQMGVWFDSSTRIVRAMPNTPSKVGYKY